MRLLVRALTFGFPYLVVLVAAAGIVYPGPAVALYTAVPFLIALMMAAIGTTLELRAILHEWKRWPWIVLILLGQAIVLPLAGLLIGLPLLGPSDRAGLILAAAAPAEASACVLILLSGGSEALGLALLVGSALASAAILPQTLRIAGLPSVTVAPAGIFLWLLAIVIGPLLLGIFLRARYLRGRQPGHGASAIAAGALLCLIYAVAGLRPAVGEPVQWLGVGLACLALNLIGYAAGWYGMGLLDARREDRLAVLFTTGMREFGVAIGLALQFFGPEPAITAALYGLTTLLSSGIALLWIRWQAPESPLAPSENSTSQ
jgi:BASS family bile acid:Na+ symporter